MPVGRDGAHDLARRGVFSYCVDVHARHHDVPRHRLFQLQDVVNHRPLFGLDNIVLRRLQAEQQELFLGACRGNVYFFPAQQPRQDVVDEIPERLQRLDQHRDNPGEPEHAP